MSRSILHTLLLTITCLCLAQSTFAAGKKLYKWVDKDGNVYYSDKVPPQHSGQEKAIINKRGITVRKIDAAKTKKQLEEERKQREKEKKLAEARKKQREHDRMLLYTYEKEADIIKARDTKLASLHNLVKISTNSLKKLQLQLNNLRSRAAFLERNGKPIPVAMKKNLKSLEKQISDTRGFISKRRQEEKQIHKLYEGYIKRFRELKGG